MASEDDVQALRAQVAALTERMYRLEQKAGMEAPARPAPPPSRREEPAPPPLTPVPSRIAPPPPSRATTPADEPIPDDELEGKIGKLWLNRIGIFAILIGVSYFIKYAFDNGWIGPSGRIALGILAGIALVLWSERFRNKGYIVFSYSLKAVGIGTLYLSLWGAFQVYHLIPSAVAFVAMIIVTASTIILSLTQDAEILAAFALIGGFSTPVLLSTRQNHEIVLFSYVASLDLAVLVITAFKPWRRLLVGSFIGTAILYVGWFSDYYTRNQRPLTVFYALLFGAIFALCPLVAPLTQSRWLSGFSVTLTLLPLVNAAAIFLALFAMYDNQRVTLTWYALALAAVYLLLSSQFKRRAGSDPQIVKAINLLHIAIAIGFITIAIPLKLNSHWITLGWLVESAVLLFIAVRTSTNFLRYFAAATLILGIVRLLAVDNFQVHMLIFNARFATYLVAIAILGAIVAVGERFASEQEKRILKIAAVTLNFLALYALSLEAYDYFSRQISEWYTDHHGATYAALHQLELARNFTYSLLWLAYGAALMTFGFWKRSAFVRWQALVLIAFTVAKVFLYDVSELQQGYRILSFIALGIVLMGISYIYHRDWLKLSDHPQANAAQKTSA